MLLESVAIVTNDLSLKMPYVASESEAVPKITLLQLIGYSFRSLVGLCLAVKLCRRRCLQQYVISHWWAFNSRLNIEFSKW